MDPTSAGLCYNGGLLLLLLLLEGQLSSSSQGTTHDILHHDSARLHAHTTCLFAFSALSAACLSALLLTFSAFFLSRFVSF